MLENEKTLKNAMEEGSSFVVTDKKGVLLKDLQNTLKENGYVVKVLNLDDARESTAYDPVAYIADESEISVFVDNVVAAINGKSSFLDYGLSPFSREEKRDKAVVNTCVKNLLTAVLAYDYETRQTKDGAGLLRADVILQNSANLDNGVPFSYLDNAFLKLAEKNPDSYAVKQYQAFRKMPDEVTYVIVRHAVLLFRFRFYDTFISNLFNQDGMRLENATKEKTAIFIIPDRDEFSGRNKVFLAHDLVGRLKKIVQAQEAEAGNLEVPVKFIGISELPERMVFASEME